MDGLRGNPRFTRCETEFSDPTLRSESLSYPRKARLSRSTRRRSPTRGIGLFLKSVLVTKGSSRYWGSLTMVVTWNHVSPFGSFERS